MQKSSAIVLAAGRGTRMQTKTAKQYLEIAGHPLVWYSLKALEESMIDTVVLVVPAGEEEECRSEYVEKAGFRKVAAVIAGGETRSDSVLAGLRALADTAAKAGASMQLADDDTEEGTFEESFVFIQDCARPLLTEEILQRGLEAVKTYGACVAGMPVKDTIKVAAGDGRILSTPERSTLWQVQTPQVFCYSWIRKAYEEWKKDGSPAVTDDAAVLERYSRHKVYLFYGSYENIKITTPEDIYLAETFLGHR